MSTWKEWRHVSVRCPDCGAYTSFVEEEEGERSLVLRGYCSSCGVQIEVNPYGPVIPAEILDVFPVTSALVYHAFLDQPMHAHVALSELRRACAAMEGVVEDE